MPSRILIFGYGNPSRGDDGLGPALLDALDSTDCECLTDFQLQVEHAMDLCDRDLVLFVDASVACPAPCHLTRLHPERDTSYTTHAISPSAVLEVYRRLHGKQPPPCFMLSIRGESFELGDGLSTAARAHLGEAHRLVHLLMGDQRVEAWEALASSVDAGVSPRSPAMADSE